MDPNVFPCGAKAVLALIETVTAAARWLAFDSANPRPLRLWEGKPLASMIRSSDMPRQMT
jgi:hypothetical protein